MSDQNQVMVRQKEFSIALSENLRAIESLGVDSKRMCRIAVNALSRNPSLLNCDKTSFVLAVMNLAEAGLEPSLGQAALVPYRGKIQAQLMYQGLVDLAWRAANIKIYSAIVRKGDEFAYVLGLDPTLKHVPCMADVAEWTHVYAVASFPDGGKIFEVMTREQVLKIKAKSAAVKAKVDTPWDTDEMEMARKTVIKRLWKTLPKTKEMHVAEDIDNSTADGVIRIPDSVEVTAEIQEAANVDTGKFITMPQEKPANNIAATTEETKNEGDLVVVPEKNRETGVLAEVKQKNGKGTKGPWTLYSLVMENGDRYSTFDKNIAEGAVNFVKKPVVITWVQDGEYKSVVSVEEAK